MKELVSEMQKALHSHILPKLMNRIRVNNYQGWDPYDILNSKLISNLQLNHHVNVLFTQINRILPINLRNIIGIDKIHNSKAMALFLSAVLNFDAKTFSDEEDYLANWLITNKSETYKEYSIGFTYNITLESYESLQGQPSLIITLFVMYAFIQYYSKTHNNIILNSILSCRDLIDQKLPKIETKNSLWYSYHFHKLSEVYNASAKVGKYYALLYPITGEDVLIEKMDKILYYLQDNQRPDGSWEYAPKEVYTDGFHTAFVLEAVYYMIQYVKNKKYDRMFAHGLAHYEQHMFKTNSQPLYFHKKYAPKDIRKVLIETDIRDCAMAIVFFSKIGKTDKAEKVLAWTLQNMYNENKGFFYYYKNKFWTNKIEFIRWQAWMFYALSVFLK